MEEILRKDFIQAELTKYNVASQTSGSEYCIFSIFLIIYDVLARLIKDGEKTLIWAEFQPSVPSSLRVSYERFQILRKRRSTCPYEQFSKVVELLRATTQLRVFRYDADQFSQYKPKTRTGSTGFTVWKSGFCNLDSEKIEIKERPELAHVHLELELTEMFRTAYKSLMKDFDFDIYKLVPMPVRKFFWAYYVQLAQYELPWNMRFINNRINKAGGISKTIRCNLEDL